MLLKVLFLILLHECHAQLHSFPIDYIGNQFSVAEYKELNICVSRVCQEDATRFISSASHNNNSDPCVNFNDFACGNFDKFQSISFDEDLKREDQHRLKTILNKEIYEGEPKIFKLVQRYFQKCVNSGSILLPIFSKSFLSPTFL